MNSLRDYSRIVTFKYPDELSAVSSDTEWSALSMVARALNEESLIADLDTRANCYAIHTRHGHGDWQLRYIGQAECGRARFSAASHLVPNRKRANAVFLKCKEAVRSGDEIGLRLIKVEPDTLRFFIQEKAIVELRNDGVLDWNQKHAA
jgi:hypothetical protein